MAGMGSESSRSRRRPRLAAARRAAASCLLGAVAQGLGCSAPPGSGRSLGTDLGTFGVDAVRAENDCGPGALGNPGRFSFDVELARDAGELHWNGSAGRIDDELEFELVASVRVELRAARGEADGGCSVVRDDSIRGALAADASGAITSLRGEMHFEFAATRESSCTLEEQVDVDLPRLPCRMRYTLSGRRTRAPMP